MIRNILAAFGLIAVIGTATVAVEAQYWDWSANDRPPSMRVSYADLDLASEAGRKTLDRRLARAVRNICGEPDLRDLRSQRREARCRRDAIRSTQPQLARAIDAANQRALAQRAADVPGAPGASQ